LELECSSVGLTHQAQERYYTHSPIASGFSVVIYHFPAHVKRVDRVRLAPDFECHVDLSIAINAPDIPAEGRNVDQLGTLDARVDCIHDIPDARRMLGDTGNK
jgi:hypothetical protein